MNIACKKVERTCCDFVKIHPFKATDCEANILNKQPNHNKTEELKNFFKKSHQRLRCKSRCTLLKDDGNANHHSGRYCLRCIPGQPSSVTQQRRSPSSKVRAEAIAAAVRRSSVMLHLWRTGWNRCLDLVRLRLHNTLDF